MNHLHDPATCVRCAAIGVGAVVKVCACGRRYTTYTWKRLPLVGYQDDEVERLELRTCACRSTICVPVDRAASEGGVGT